MRILTDSYREEIYYFDFQDNILRVYFLLNQVDIIDKSSLLYDRLSIHNLIPVPLIQEDLLIKKTNELIKSLYLNKRFKVFQNQKNRRYFVVNEGEKFIEVDTELNGLTDITHSLFWQNNYKLKRPETGPDSFLDIYFGIYGKIENLAQLIVKV